MIPANVMDTRMFETSPVFAMPYGQQAVSRAIRPAINSPIQTFYADWFLQAGNPKPGLIRVRQYTLESYRHGVKVWVPDGPFPIIFRSLRTARKFCKTQDVTVTF